MSKFKAFFKENKKAVQNAKFAAVSDFIDDNGNVLEWEIKPLTTAEHERIRDNASTMGANMSFDFSKYKADMLVASIVYPDLFDEELQDNYGVKKPVDLLKAMVSNAGEYDKFYEFVAELNGFKTINDEVEAAKN